MRPTLESIWHEFSDRLGQFIRARVNDPAAADDLRQEVFVRIQRRLGGLRDLTKLESWLYHIARHAIIDHYRARRETTEVPVSLPAGTPEHDPELEGLMAAFRRMVDNLPEPYRQAVVLTEMEGLTQRELAERAGISLSGAKSRVQRGRALLKADLEACCRFEFDARGRVLDCEPRQSRSCPECG